MQKPNPVRAQQQTQAKLGLDDIYFILFKHKWKIILSFVLGLAVAGGLLLMKGQMYESSASLLVRYILDTKSVTPTEEEAKRPPQSSESIINSEIEILTSFDMALTVADKVGPEKILAMAGGGTNRYTAAALIKNNLRTEVPRRSNIIRIILRHPDPGLVRVILEGVVDAYLQKHMEVHRSVGIFDEFLSQKTDELRSRLTQTEEELRKLKNQAKVISFDDAKKSLSMEMASVRAEIFSTSAELAGKKATLAELEKLNPSASSGTNTFDAPDAKVNEYKRLVSRLASMQKRLLELETQYTPESAIVSSMRDRVTAAETEKAGFEKEFPKLAAIGVPVANPTGAAAVDPLLEKTRITALEAKLTALNLQLEKIRTEAVAIDEISVAVASLERKKQLEESNYRYYSANLEQARVDETLGTSRMSNINKVQAPSPPVQDMASLRKSVMMAIAAGLLGGIALAFLIELVLDQTVKRPNEVENNLGLPLYLTVPALKNCSYEQASIWKRIGSKFKRGGTAEIVAAENNFASELTLTHEDNPMVTYSDALRDRVVGFFEENNITRTPKLIGVTSCTKKSGVTTIAAGLAASLSNTGHGKVLLVDLNLKHGAVHPYFEGAPVPGLLDVLDKTEHSSAQVQEKLDVVSANGNNGSALSIRSKQFTDLLPRLKTSDYDYIVFDLPPVNQTSATIRLSGFLDQVLFVLEAGQTDRRVVKRSLAHLSTSNPNVAAVLNKTPVVVPGWLQPEIS